MKRLGKEDARALKYTLGVKTGLFNEPLQESVYEFMCQNEICAFPLGKMRVVEPEVPGFHENVHVSCTGMIRNLDRVALRVGEDEPGFRLGIGPWEEIEHALATKSGIRHYDAHDVRQRTGGNDGEILLLGAYFVQVGQGSAVEQVGARWVAVGIIEAVLLDTTLIGS